MTTHDFITALFCQVDDQLPAIPKHPEAHLCPARSSPWGSPCAQAWAPRLLSLADQRLSALVPSLPERTRLFRLLKTHQDWTTASWPAPTVLGVIDTLASS